MTGEVSSLALRNLLAEVRNCRVCEANLPMGPKPVLRAESSAKLLIIGQAPGTRVHASGVPWDDPSGDRLRDWMGIDRSRFYDAKAIAIMPMGFCYPGKGKSGDLPPRAECAPLWHQRILGQLPNVRLTLLVGSYAQSYYLRDGHATLGARLQHWRDYMPGYFPLVHPSPRNTRWLRQHPWFEAEVVPVLRHLVSTNLAD